MTSAPTSPRVLLECIKAGQAAHKEGLCRVDNPYTRRPTRYESLLLRDADLMKMAEAWWKGWDLAERAAQGGGVHSANGDSP